MPNIYLTVNHYNKDRNISPWRYIGSDQHDNDSCYGSSADLKKDIAEIGIEHFTKELLYSIDVIDNKKLRLLESTYLQQFNVKQDITYYNKTDIYGPGGGVKGMRHSKKFARTDNWKNSRKGWIPSEETRNLWKEQRAGRIVDSSTKEKMSASRQGSKNANALQWEIITPDGNIILTNCLTEWCRENNIPFSRIYEQHKGYKLNKLGAGKGGPRKKNESN